MFVELLDHFVNDFYNHVNSFDNVFNTLDRDLNNFNAFTYHRISVVHVNKWKDVVLAHDMNTDDFFRKKSLFVVDFDHQLDIIGVDAIRPVDDPEVLHGYYLQELNGVDELQRELRFHLGRMEDTYRLLFKPHDYDEHVLKYADDFKKRYSMYLQMCSRFKHAVKYRHVIEQPIAPKKSGDIYGNALFNFRRR